ncbi:MAG: hypothetical protein OEW89_02345 [Gammaproteobacteria bacterium]|nr:hypothetical protein [Gammaproteobacteria bacterium]
MAKEALVFEVGESGFDRYVIENSHKVPVFVEFMGMWSEPCESSVMQKVFAEGLTVAAWVSMWEALATFLINWTPISKKIMLYKRIANTSVQFV